MNNTISTDDRVALAKKRVQIFLGVRSFQITSDLIVKRLFWILHLPFQ
jgi:hypothetical protein